MKTLQLSWGLCAAALVITSNARAATQDVSIAGFAFQPPSVSINTGDSVRWTDSDNAFHTSTSDTGVWDSGILNGTQYTFQFTASGEYPYHCTSHAFMTASVSVTPGANQPPSVTITNPVDNVVFGNTDSVAVRGFATDSDGSVTNIQVFNGNVLLRNVTSASFSFNVTAISGSLALGTNTLTAVATDNLGLKGTSAPVHVVISRYLPPIPTANIGITLLAVATNLSAPLYGISPPGDKTRLFVLEQNGLIRVIQNGVLQPDFGRIATLAAIDSTERVPPLTARMCQGCWLFRRVDERRRRSRREGMRPMVPRPVARRPPSICGNPHVTAGCGRQRRWSLGYPRAADRFINFAGEPKWLTRSRVCRGSLRSPQ
jgi:plastocyanin